MTVLVIGATGPTGQKILAAARASGLSVRALARRPEALAETGVEIAKGDVRDLESLKRAMQGASAVISALGTPLILKGPVTLLSEGTRNIIRAMEAEGISRFLCVTGMGAGDSRGHGGFLYDRIILPLLLGRVYADKDRQEAVVRESALDWTLVRPAFLKDEPARGQWREITSWTGEPNMTAIARADVADFLVKEVAAHRYSRKAVNLSW